MSYPSGDFYHYYFRDTNLNAVRQRGMKTDRANGPDAMQLVIGEQEIEEPGDGFLPVPLALKAAVQREPDFGLLGSVGTQAVGAVADELAGVFQGDGKLEPFTGCAGLHFLHFPDEGVGLFQGVW